MYVPTQPTKLTWIQLVVVVNGCSRYAISYYLNYIPFVDSSPRIQWHIIYHGKLRA